MKFNDKETDILNNLVGTMEEHTTEVMVRNIDCFLHPKVSLFIPSRGHCAYAVTPNHAHPSYTFVYYFQPVQDFISEGRHLSFDLSEGKCLSAISPEIPHQEIKEDYFQSYIVIAIDKEHFYKAICSYTAKIPIFRGEAYTPHPELLSVLRCFMMEANKGSEGNDELLDHLSHVITHLAIRSVIGERDRVMQLYDRFEVDRAISYMNGHLSEKVTIEELADHVNLSAGHFSKIFKTVTGETPIDFLNSLRLQKACILLMSNEQNITEVAMNCGFSSSSYFSACFLERYHTTPSAYRQNYVK